MRVPGDLRAAAIATVGLAAGLLAVQGCGGGEAEADADAAGETGAAAAETPALPDVVTISDPGLHPEGIEWDAVRNRFLVSSVTRGTVTAVADDGTHTVFAGDAPNASSIGIHIDRDRDRLLVAAADVSALQGASTPGMLVAYDLASGAELFRADLAATIGGAGPFFPNDMTVGPDGAAYVTDSQQSVIYAVTPEGEASVYARGGALEAGGFLNGIDLHPDGYLIVSTAGTRDLAKVTLAAEPVITSVAVSEPFGSDGLTFRPDGRLVAVASTGEGEDRRSEILLLESTDGWATASVVGRADAADAATTATVRDGEVYYVDARFGDMGGDTPAPAFDLTRVRFQ